MKTHDISGIVFFSVFMTLCPTAFAQYKIEEMSERLDAQDRAAVAARTNSGQTQTVQNVQTNQPVQTVARIDGKTAYRVLSKDDSSLFDEFSKKFEQCPNERALYAFDGKSKAQVYRVIRAIIKDNPAMSDYFKKLGITLPATVYNSGARNAQGHQSPYDSEDMVLNIGNGYFGLSADEREIYFDFRNSYQYYKSVEYPSRYLFNLISDTQMDNIVSALIQDNPSLEEDFERYGYVLPIFDITLGFVDTPEGYQISVEGSKIEGRSEVHLTEYRSNLAKDFMAKSKNGYSYTKDALSVFRGVSSVDRNETVKEIVRKAPLSVYFFKENGLVNAITNSYQIENTNQNTASNQNTENYQNTASNQNSGNYQNTASNQNTGNSQNSYVYQNRGSNRNAGTNQHYPYDMYSFLTNTEKWIYDAIFDDISNARTTIEITDRDMLEYIDKDEISHAVSALYIDHAEFVWMTQGYSYSTSSLAGERISMTIKIQYNALAGDPEKYQREFEEAANELLSHARQQKSAYDMERYVYDYLVTVGDYGHNEIDQTGYATLVWKQAVCGGYAKTFNYLMKRLGIPSYYLLGYTEKGEFHAWNAVYMNGDWLYVDSTSYGSGEIETYDDLVRRENVYFNRPMNSDFWVSPDSSNYFVRQMPIW